MKQQRRTKTFGSYAHTILALEEKVKIPDTIFVSASGSESTAPLRKKTERRHEKIIYLEVLKSNSL
jgi:hypothetical protein